VTAIVFSPRSDFAAWAYSQGVISGISERLTSGVVSGSRSPNGLAELSESYSDLKSANAASAPLTDSFVVLEMYSPRMALGREGKFNVCRKSRAWPQIISDAARVTRRSANSRLVVYSSLTTRCRRVSERGGDYATE
jgi:hypothetical protein